MAQKKHKANIGCPITCGIFAWIAAYTSKEEKLSGKKNLTPWWRTLKTGGQLNEKYPGGLQNQKKLLQKEGHKIVQKGNNCFLEDYEKSLLKI